jgi:hypothetical protein
MKLRSKVALPIAILAGVALLLGSAGTVVVLSTHIVAPASIYSGHWLWEPTSAVGSSTWVHAWKEYGNVPAYASSWNGSSWSSPQPLTRPDGFGIQDVNMNWDSTHGRFIFAAIDDAPPNNVWYGHSTDASGTAWVIGNNGQPVMSASGAGIWDYPSIGADASGRVIIGAGGYAPCPSGIGGPTGYSAVVSTNGDTFSGPSPVVTFTNGCQSVSGYSGPESRVVATNNRFEAFVPLLDSNGLPTYIGRWESPDGVSWTGDLGIGMGGFGAPNNNTPGSHGSTFCCY